MSEDVKISEPPKRRAPTLYIIIAGKLIKGTLAVALALIIFKLAGWDLSEVFGNFLQWFHLDPESRFFSEMGAKLEKITPANVRWVGIVTVLYSLISFVEAVGLMLRVPWAGWLAIGESAFFIPIEVRELILRPNWYVLGVLAFNILIVWYLYANRSWLFRHHHH